MIWGLIVLATYIGSWYTDEDAFYAYWSYSGKEENYLQPFRALFASRKFENVTMTVPVLILGGYYLKEKMGNLHLLRFWQVSITCCFVSLVLFGPHRSFLWDW